MKKIKILLTVFAVAVMSVTGYNAYDNYTMSDNEKLIFENIEALTNDDYKPGVVTSGCKAESVVIRCYAECDGCPLEWETKRSGGPAKDVRGKCTCGSTSFTY